MVKDESHPLVVGIPGPTVTADERLILDRVRPAGVVLFERNIESADQVRALAEELSDLEPRPFLAIDMEGGAVNRLQSIWGPLPSPAEAAAGGRKAVRALGEAVGAACRSLGVHLDLAPVVDLVCAGGTLADEGRCLGDDPERVITLAGVFYDGLESWCVGGCLKHFPGLGPVAVDTHHDLASLDLSMDDLEPHLVVFRGLSERIGLVMTGHVVVPALGDAERPVSLSRAAIERAAALPGSPVILSDDLEMGALDSFGPLPDRVFAALRARNHGVLVCRAFDQLDDVAERLRQAVADDSALGTRMAHSASRLGTLRRDLCRATATVPMADDTTVEQLWAKARSEAGTAA